MFNKDCGCIYMSVTEFGDPAHEDDYNQWYSYEHLPHFCESGTYYRASRYQTVTAGSPKYVSVYETRLKDPEEARRIHDAERNIRATTGLVPYRDNIRSIYQTVSSVAKPNFELFQVRDSADSTGMVMLGFRPRTSDYSEELRGWYETVFADRVKKTGLFDACWAFTASELGMEVASYIHYYPTSQENVPQAMAALRSIASDLQSEGEYYEDQRLVFRDGYGKMMSYDRPDDPAQ